MKNNNQVFTPVEVGIVCFILLLLALLGYGGWHLANVDMPEAFAAWSKHTGNPNHLTFQEWRALTKVNEPKANVVIIHQP